MTTRAMRAIDRFGGIPLCLATGLFVRLFRRNASPAGTPANILVIKFFGLGSVLLSTPFLSALREQLPQSRITYLSFSSNSELIARIPEVTRAIFISNSTPVQFFLSTLRALRMLRDSSFDTVFDLEFFSKFSTLISVLSGAPTRIGFSLPTRWRRWNLTASVPFDHAAHVTSVFLAQLQTVRGSIGAQPPVISLTPSEEERASVRRKLHLSGDGTVSVCININAGQTSLERRWDPDRFARVAGILADRRRSVRLYFTGSPAERPYVERLLTRHPDLRPRSVNCAGLLSLGELIALLEHSRLLITNDSAPMHIADAVGTPTIALFGPESPRFYGPSRRAETIYKALPCSPCLNVYTAKMFTCPFDARCMRDITVGDVVQAVERLLPVAQQTYSAMNELVH